MKRSKPAFRGRQNQVTRNHASTNAAPRGQLYVLEGPDGVGKSTIAQALAEALHSAGLQAEVFSFPGREAGTLGQLVYRLHHDCVGLGVESVTESSRQALHVAAHIDAIETRILPALRKGIHVVLD